MGLLRQYFPKKMSPTGVTHIEADEAVCALNHRPRKCFGYRTPHKVFYRVKVAPHYTVKMRFLT